MAAKTRQTQSKREKSNGHRNDHEGLVERHLPLGFSSLFVGRLVGEDDLEISTRLCRSRMDEAIMSCRISALRGIDQSM